MSADEQAGRADGGVPHAYRNALFWRWAPAMPARLPAAFVTVLYACGAAADKGGRLRFRDGKPIRIRDLAAAAKADEKDVRRYLDAAIAAGVLGVEGERRRGTPTLYVLLLSPRPDWGAAVASLAASRRKSRKAPPWLEDQEAGDTAKFGGHAPEPENGGHAPELGTGGGEKERGTRPRTSSGDTPPFGSGDTPPNNPGITQDISQDMAEVGGQPEPLARDTTNKINPAQDKTTQDQPAGVRRCDICHDRLIFDTRRPNRTRHTHCEPQRAIQPPLLLGVPTPQPDEPDAQPSAEHHADTA